MLHFSSVPSPRSYGLSFAKGVPHLQVVRDAWRLASEPSADTGCLELLGPVSPKSAAKSVA